MTNAKPTVITGQEEILFPGGRIRFLNGTDNVRSTMTLLEIDGATLLVDCGADPFEPQVELPDEAYEVDGVLLTHGHMDHIGGIPALLASGFFAPIIATETTLAITRITLGDCIRQRGGEHRDVRAFIGGLNHMARCVPMDTVYKPLVKRDIEIIFHPAGHILGAASIEIKSSRARLLFSGDIGPDNLPVAGSPNAQWQNHIPFDVVVLEATRGDITKPPSNSEVAATLKRVIRRAKERGGHILVPAAIMGRTQELIHHFSKLGEADESLRMPVALDTAAGLRIANNVTPFYALENPELLATRSNQDDPLDIDGLHTIRKTKDPKKLKDLASPTLIVTGFGHCDAGRIVPQLRELLPFQENTLLFIGYQPPGTLSNEIASAAQAADDTQATTVELNNSELSIRAAVETIPGLYAHAVKPELVAWAKRIPNVRKIALHHGTPSAQSALAKALEA